MLFWIILGIGLISAFIAICMRVAVGWKLKTKNRLDSVIFWGITGGLILAFSIPTTISTIKHEVEIITNVDSYELVSLLDNQNSESHASGSFILIAGEFSSNTETNLNYNWYQKASNGAITGKQGIAEDEDTHVEIFFINNNETPHVEYEKKDANNITDSWVAPIDLCVHDNYDVEKNEYWRLYVPRGTVDKQYKLDLK